MIKKYKKTDDVSYTLGITLTIELLKSKVEQVRKVYFHSKFDENNSKDLIIDICNKHNIEIIYSDKAFNILSDKENSYVIGEFEKYESPLSDTNHLFLVNPSNNGNLGTIIRSAVGFGVTNIGIIKPAVDIFNPSVVRASMGSLFHINFEYYDNFEEYSNKYSERSVYPFMLKAKKSLSEVDVKGKYTLLFGNEATGLSDDYLKIGDAIIIKHSNTIDSLNLPVAVSLALYEFTKRDYK